MDARAHGRRARGGGAAHDRAHHRRIGRRKRTRGARDPRALDAHGSTVRRGELRVARRRTARGRVVRLRERCVHGRAAQRSRGICSRPRRAARILLDEIGELDLGLQARLLRVLQERTYRPVGADRDRAMDVRILAATNRDLGRDGGRRALPRRPLLPPERALDPRAGAARPARGRRTARAAFRGRFERGTGPRAAHVRRARARARRSTRLARQRARAAQRHRTRARSIERPDDRDRAPRASSRRPLSKRIPSPRATWCSTSPTTRSKSVERALIERVLAETAGNRSAAARVLGVNRATLYNKLRVYDLTA